MATIDEWLQWINKWYWSFYNSHWLCPRLFIKVKHLNQPWYFVYDQTKSCTPDPGSMHLGQSPRDWGTTMHWNVVPTSFHKTWDIWLLWKIVKTIFQCTIVLQLWEEGHKFCPVRDKISMLLSGFSPQLEDNGTLNYSSPNFPQLPSIWGLKQNCWNDIAMYRWAPIAGRLT